MSRPLHRRSVAAAAALSVTALALGLTAPAGAHPISEPHNPEGVEATVDQLRESPLFDLIPGATADQLTRVSGPRTPVARIGPTAATSSTPVVEEVARTEISATFRFTLPSGEVTREDSVLQAYWTSNGLRYSALEYLTNPVGVDGVEHDSSYAEQLIGMEMADLLRENFSISGATAVTGGVNDYLVVPAGLNSFDITVTSARTEAQLSNEIEAITGGSSWNYNDARWFLDSRLALPQGQIWAYGEQLDVLPFPHTSAQYRNGANELTATGTRGMGDLTFSVKRGDDAPFSGNRALKIDTATIFGAGFLGSDVLFDIIVATTPPPLRPVNLNTVVTGAAPVGDGFFAPNNGVTEVVATTTHDGPQTLEEARAEFTTWVTETCDAEMSDVIPGFGQIEDGEPVTWQGYLDTLQEGDNGPVNTQAPIYAEPEDFGSVLQDIADRGAFYRYMLLSSSGEEEGMFPNPFDWNAACGNSEGPGDGQQPASVTLDIPSAGVAGEPITLSATVLDDAGDPVEGQQVTFTIEEQEAVAGTLRAAALTIDPAADERTTLTATTGPDGVATVEYIPSTSGMLHVSASTGGSNPVSTGPISLIPVTPAPGDGDGDNNPGGGSQNGAGSLGSLFGSLGS